MKHKFDLIIKHLGNKLVENGFVKAGPNFFKEVENNVALISFKKHKFSNKMKVLFTIDIGIRSRNLSLLWGYSDLRKPDIEECQWKSRIGHLLPIKKDYWWEIEEKTDIEKLSYEIDSIIFDIVIPAIEDNLTDSQLEENWINNDLRGVDTTSRYLYLTALFKLYNRPEFNSLMNEFSNYCDRIHYQSVFQKHQDRLESVNAYKQ